ncbi:hypothetical protein L204_103407 [Cryptococcus depauperatus]|nr:phosphatidate phosphatase LPIN [Cryptococcus depauperatus CBS 7855]
MQYLSKAYNYYSGINPATLSGAIDVIVVRHVEADGNVTLSSSPFHVRFGKLQVLRAAEKRVTIRLPNNLPAPHVAPFSMKVGETGEAFFVVETDEQVPEDLLTSPVVMPTEAELPTSSSPPDEYGGETEQENSFTHEPFGQTEQQVPHETPLQEVDFLDLNAGSETPRIENSTGSTSKSILNTATSLLPSIGFNSLPNLHLQEPNQAGPHSSDEANAKRKEDDEPVVSTTTQEPNPMSAEPGESTGLPDRNHKLESIKAGENAATAEEALPKISPGEGEGPEVLYGRDVVLDMEGYHSSQNKDSQQEHDPSVEAFILDLLASVQPNLEERPRPRKSLSAGVELPSLDTESDDEETTPVETPKQSLPEVDLPASLAAMGIHAGRSLSERMDRGQSEPPQLQDELPHPLDAAGAKAAMEMEWDWGRRRPVDHATKPQGQSSGKLKNVEENPYIFVFEIRDCTHAFELSICKDFGENTTEASQEASFVKNRLTFQTFVENPRVVDDPNVVVRYNNMYFTWSTGYRLLYVLAMYRRTLAPPFASASSPTLPALSGIGTDNAQPQRSSGYGWSRWWRRGQSSGQVSAGQSETAPASTTPVPASPVPEPESETTIVSQTTNRERGRHYAKTLRLSSDQLQQLHLKPGPNTIQFSVTSSYSGMATCTARIFLWEDTDQIVISDIDGTITKSDALGHVFAAIGRDWTHLGIAQLYTDICNNGYKLLYLTSRAIGQADTTREYLRSIIQGSYRMPEGPVLMSPDRLMASLRREVIMRKPELFKMACLRDIQRLFGMQAKEAFFAGFGNRITDAMSYRSVGIETSKIYTIDSTGVVKTELLSAAGHKGSYIQLNDLVNEVFPPVSTKFKPKFTEFNYWRDPIPDIPIPDLTPPSPALSARSDTSGRLSVLGKITGIGRRSSRATIGPNGVGSQPEPSSRPSSPLIAPSWTSDDVSEAEYEEGGEFDTKSVTSMPGSFKDKNGSHFHDGVFANQTSTSQPTHTDEEEKKGGKSENNVHKSDKEEEHEEGDYDDDAIFDDDILAAGEMQHVPF